MANKAVEKKTGETMNPPTVDKFADVAFAKESEKRNKAIRAELKKVDSSFYKIAFNLYWFYESKGYEQLGYKNVYEFATKEYGIARGTTNNFINVAGRFGERDETGKITDKIRTEYKDFQSSKLIAMLGVSDEELKDISSDMSVRDIKKVAKKFSESDVQESDGQKPSKNEDIVVEAKEVNRATLITFSTMEEYNKYLDGMNDLVEKALKSKACKEGGKKIEIALVW